MNLFFAETLNKNGGTLGKEESHHASRVLRLIPGNKVLTTQGKGLIYTSRLDSVSKTSVSFTNEALFKEEKQSRNLHIAIAPTKSNDRFEFFLEKATELGIDTISPIICRHSERKVYKTERGKKIISAAAKQSLACNWPQLNEAKTFSEFLSTQDADIKYIAHCQSDDLPNLLPSLQSLQNALVLIGPEGDFNINEIDLAKQAGYKEISLGSKRLRTETAGLAVALAFNLN